MTPRSARMACCVSVLGIAGCAAEEPVPASHMPGLEVEILREIVLTEDARIPENDPAYVDVEVHPDRLVFTFDGGLEGRLETGNVVVGSAGETGYLRRVTALSPLPDGRLDVRTEPAGLVDLIYQGHFIVRYEPPAPAAGATEALTAEVAGRRAALDSEGGGVDLVFGHGTLTSCEIGGEIAPHLSFDYTFELEVDIDWERAFWVVPKPKLAKFRLEIGGAVYAGIEFDGRSGADIVCDDLDLTRAFGVLRSGPGDIRLPTLTFSIGPVPVVITNEIEPVLELSIDQHLEPSEIDLSAEARFGLVMGVLYEDGEWSPIWRPDAFADGSFRARSVGAIQISDRLAAGFEYQALLYDLAGPTMGLEGFVDANGGTGPDLCTWELAIEAGLTATFGGVLELELELPVLPDVDWEIARLDIGEVELVRSPVWTGGGTFPWCEECAVGAASCIDDLGRSICNGNEGILMCSGGIMRCTCAGGAGFTECGPCVASE